MREINEYTAEVRRRVEAETKLELDYHTQRQHRLRVLAACIPLVLCAVLGAVFLPPLVRRSVANTPDAIGPGMNKPGDGAVSDDAVFPGPDGIATEERAADDGLSGSEADGLPGPADMVSSQDGVPADFSFRFVWGCYGISSYDSRTGRLVKTTDATHPEDYVTELFLTDEQRQTVWELLSGLALETYPADFDPYNDPDAEQRVASEPSRDLILSLRVDGKETTVTCRGICLGGVASGYDRHAQVFLNACDRLEALLQSTPEWQAMPDYEFLYE